MNTPKNVAELAIETLIANGIDQLYCLPGVQNDHFFDALYDRTDGLRPIQSRHEQGAAYMAMGAALATGKQQAFCVVPGPGFLNTTAALSTAYAVNAPVLALVGQIPLPAVGKGHGLLHEIPDQLSIMQGLTKHSARVNSGDDADQVLTDAMIHLQSGRPQPVGVEIPVNVWRSPLAKGSNSTALQIAAPKAAPPDEDAIKQAIALINSSKAPMIVAGGGAMNFSQEVTQLTDAISAASLAFRNGQGVVSHENDLRIGMPVAHQLWSETDLVIGLGTRLQSQVQAWGSDEDLKIIHIDIDDTQLGRSAKTDIAINADLADALPMLLAGMETNQRQDWRDRIASAKAKMAKAYAQNLGPQLAWLNAIRMELPRQGIFVDELTQCGYVSRFAFPCFEPRTFISTGYQGTLGYGFATALGVAHARRDVPVVAISGDGGALFTLSELATAVHHKIPLTTVIFNDNAYGNVRRLQKDNYDSRFIASELTSPDFVKLAEGFGAIGMRANTPEELRLKLREAIKSPEPVVIEVPVSELPSPWDYVLMPKLRGI
ncbi:MAG: thiamine pyrophosphate-dependent enzyme [Rhizobiaceae bacterium]